MMSAERRSWCTRRRMQQVFPLVSAFTLRRLTSPLTAARNDELSGHVSQKVRFGTKTSLNDPDITWIEEENQVEMEVLEEGGGHLCSKGIME